MRLVRQLAFFGVVILLAMTTIGWGQTTHRPITDFTSAQVTTVSWVNSENLVFQGVVDFAGVTQRWIFNNCGLDIGAVYTGDVTETALAPGKTKVHVVVHAENAFLRAFLYEDGTPVLGYTRAEVCAGMGAPMQGDITFTLDFLNNQDPGGPLPDITELTNDPAVLPYLQSVLVNASGKGTVRFLFDTPPGAPAMMHVLQRGVYPQGKGVPDKDYFPAELVNVKPLL